jgi:Na+/melibiose symporter-like transporter
LQFGGYISQAGAGTVTQPTSVSGAIRVIIGPIPMVIFILAFVIIGFYPLDRKEYRERTKK